MNDIKVKNKENSIKLVDKSKILGERMKNVFKNNIKKADTNSNQIEYAVENTVGGAKKIRGKFSVKNTKKTYKQAKKGIYKSYDHIVDLKNSLNLFKKKNMNNLKPNLPVIKRKKNSFIKFKEFLKNATLGSKAMFSLFFAGGWVLIFLIILFCFIGIFVSSIYGIFFSNYVESSVSLNTVISEINQEMADKISNIQEENPHDEVLFTVNRASWKKVLSIYSSYVSLGRNSDQVLMFTQENIKALKKVFWDINSVNYYITEEIDDSFIPSDLNPGKTKKILHIEIQENEIDTMMDKYKFTLIQKNSVLELLDEKNADLWSSILKSSNGDGMVDVAVSQIGNVGGEIYWKWYGFEERVEWCAIFVSWVAEQNGYIEKNIIPKFSGCFTGVNWFKAVGLWQDSNYIPNKGDIIFFNWDGDDLSDHVGIVEKVEGDVIYTIEGNSNDMCREQTYSINSNNIFGYGTPMYN